MKFFSKVLIFSLFVLTSPRYMHGAAEASKKADVFTLLDQLGSSCPISEFTGAVIGIGNLIANHPECLLLESPNKSKHITTKELPVSVLMDKLQHKSLISETYRLDSCAQLIVLMVQSEQAHAFINAEKLLSQAAVYYKCNSKTMLRLVTPGLIHKINILKSLVPVLISANADIDLCWPTEKTTIAEILEERHEYTKEISSAMNLQEKQEPAQESIAVVVTDFLFEQETDKEKTVLEKLRARKLQKIS